MALCMSESPSCSSSRARLWEHCTSDLRVAKRWFKSKAGKRFAFDADVLGTTLRSVHSRRLPASYVTSSQHERSDSTTGRDCKVRTPCSDHLDATLDDLDSVIFVGDPKQFGPLPQT